SFRFDGIEIPAASLHAQSIDAVSEQVLPGELDRGVSSAVHDEIGIGADQAGRVDAQSERLPPARRVVVAILSCFGVGPAVLHPASLDHHAGAFEHSRRATNHRTSWKAKDLAPSRVLPLAPSDAGPVARGRSHILVSAPG